MLEVLKIGGDPNNRITIAPREFQPFHKEM
jgi:hypothetical protein